MLHIFFNTLPFFALIALGYVAAKRSIFSQEATAHLTKFVFYFALSAMLFRFAANLSLAEIFGLVVRRGLFVGLFRGLCDREQRWR